MRPEERAQSFIYDHIFNGLKDIDPDIDEKSADTLAEIAVWRFKRNEYSSVPNMLEEELNAYKDAFESGLYASPK